MKNNQEIFTSNPFGFPTRFRWENYQTALSTFNVPRYFMNSLFISTITVAVTVLIALMFAYAVARMQWRFQNVARTYLLTGMFIPIQVIMIPLSILMRDLHISNTYEAVILPYIAFNLSFSMLVFYGFFRSLPYQLEESGCIDGASIYRVFWSIILPLMKPAVATVSIFVFLAAWNEFPMALILIVDEKLKTLPLGLVFFQGQFTTDWGAMGAAMTIASLPTVLIYLLFSEQVERSLTVGSAVKG
ncbi:carbohydrate ABC transporter permease [Paenibacillus sp. LHD-117]|uniref:carbohydrate ABC transporter permease n=1 Tax=Paenibacillus sp. LHD-117 TaxID=3071412 RepID=UPI0027DF9063|nr:carbohydrate ABC transporter permease [Paenibacillus sp. LHD-117]MDQ6420500.1 carbohydrate ABC transporter permease [Paenibacillus sp. LHD-117]